MEALARVPWTARSPAAVGERQILAVQMKRNWIRASYRTFRMGGHHAAGRRVRRMPPRGPIRVIWRPPGTRVDRNRTLGPSDNSRMGLLAQRFLRSSPQ
jgi:hypothetical protein